MNQKNANDDGSQREPLLSTDTEWQRNARMTREDTWRIERTPYALATTFKGLLKDSLNEHFHRLFQ